MYGLQAADAAYVQQFDGKVIPWVRYMGWVVMTPVLLGQINCISSHRILGLNANTMLIGERPRDRQANLMSVHLRTRRVSLMSVHWKRERVGMMGKHSRRKQESLMSVH